MVKPEGLTKSSCWFSSGSRTDSINHSLAEFRSVCSESITNSFGCSALPPAPPEDSAEQMVLFPRHSFSAARLQSTRFAVSLNIPVPPQQGRSLHCKVGPKTSSSHGVIFVLRYSFFSFFSFCQHRFNFCWDLRVAISWEISW